MLFGGHTTEAAWTEARSSFVHGNFAATVLLCQALVENLLAAFLHDGLLMDDLPPRVRFEETLNRCRARNLITEEDGRDLKRLMALRNPLCHFRPVSDSQSLDGRALASGLHAQTIIERDAAFAIISVVRILAKPSFAIGSGLTVVDTSMCM